MNNFKMFLEENLKKVESELIKNVIDDLLDLNLTSEELYKHCIDILNYGCVSGCVISLIYYSDTEKFFKDNCVDIMNMLNEYREEVGELPNIDITDINILAWFAYENTVYTLINEYDYICEYEEE